MSELRSRTGITTAEYDALLAAQGGHCALCPSVPKSRRLHVDHDHKTGEVRGLLCYRDNRTLAAWATPAWLDSAYRYLARHELTQRGRLRYAVEDRGYETPCWVWQRATSSGYAVLRYRGQLLYVHRLMFLGLIADNEHVHHRCEVRHCIRSDHLEPMARGEHTRHHARKAATCKRGHPWTPENTYLRPDGSGLRQCLTCIRLRSSKAWKDAEWAIAPLEYVAPRAMERAT